MIPSTILVIEDEPMLLEYLSRALQKAGFNVLTSSDAKRGLETAEDNLPDIILLDLLLPDGGGEEFLKNLKASEKTKGIPVIVLTNLADTETKERCQSLGVVDFLVKADYRLDQIVEKIQTIFQTQLKK